MSSTHTSLDAAAVDRKTRLAELASLKRKQPGSDVTAPNVQEEEQQTEEATSTNKYLSGRNYDTANKNAKLGFESVPIADAETLEQQAERIAAEAAEQAAKDEAEAEKGIDLFKLQPKKPNWDLKRDLAEKMKILDVRTQNAIARLVRERIENAKKDAVNSGKAPQASQNGDQGEEVGMEGSTLVEGIHLREQEEEREAQLEEEEADIS
ncbi:cwf18 pre-mRNA splicing factor-domain-containing protein [Exophiala viscosa]|uniref:Cwf18 pre-mRNA splicing factor-domain-containing protein n=1 Tax=Exophiala viscosa TaxID=2486360 RepID=A0AAN6IE46_9EURO|nr:cwf18 pre-mRNA splicing factor-domain-containing protein [Exophiala viscosa]KAI1622363.1 cwf18 pre-mRNA splicing factor-domain-containing protein [Exophiala viscosa]